MARQTIPNAGLWSTITTIFNSMFIELYERPTIQASITYPVVPAAFSVTGTGNTELNPLSGGYVLVTDQYASVFLRGNTFEMTTDGRVRVLKNAAIKIIAYLDLKHSSNNSTVGAVFAIDRAGGTIYSSRSVRAKMPTAGDISNISGVGMLQALAGDIITTAVASNLSGTVTISTSSVVMESLG
jgi:hypothetical protein